jgi:hypothetical protein
MIDQRQPRSSRATVEGSRGTTLKPTSTGSFDSAQNDGALR